MGQMKVIVADDNDKMRKLIRDGISADQEIQVVGMAQNGLEACELVRIKKPDVLLLDLIMPKLDGISVLERLASTSDFHKCPYVIVISAVTSEKIIREVFEKGALYYFVKPFDSNTLINRIKSVVQSKGNGRIIPREIQPYESRDHVVRRDMENEVTDIFHRLGIPAHLKGYQYLREAILLVLFHSGRFYSITKDIYPIIAEKNCASAYQVERAMRHAIEIGWCRGNIDTIDMLFGYTVQHERGKPTNSEFIALIADKLRGEFLL